MKNSELSKVRLSSIFFSSVVRGTRGLEREQKNVQQARQTATASSRRREIPTQARRVVVAAVRTQLLLFLRLILPAGEASGSRRLVCASSGEFAGVRVPHYLPHIFTTPLQKESVRTDRRGILEPFSCRMVWTRSLLVS